MLEEKINLLIKSIEIVNNSLDNDTIIEFQLNKIYTYITMINEFINYTELIHINDIYLIKLCTNIERLSLYLNYRNNVEIYSIISRAIYELYNLLRELNNKIV